MIEMITMSKIGKIRRLHLRDKLSISEVSRRTGLTRNTIRRWLKVADGTEPKYKRKVQAKLLTPFEESLKQWLEADKHRPRSDRRTARKLFGQLREQGFTGSYSRVTEFVRRWHDREGTPGCKAFIPLKFELGEAFQFDWSEEMQRVGGVTRKLQVAHVKLCASRAFWLVAYWVQSQEMLFDAHTRAFRAFGGIPRRGIYDNMKTAVDDVGKGKQRIVNIDSCPYYNSHSQG
ncbi:hypothetical protein CCP4SC76_290012 [Gammaproteobacteria bacterium]